METAANWVQLYVAACGEVLTAANACLEPANLAVNAQDMLTNRPYEYRNTPEQFFRGAIEEYTKEFTPLYRTFEEACTAARDTARQLLSSDPLRAEMVLAMSVSEDVLDNVATAKGILGATYGPTPAAFLEGIGQANALMQDPPDEGNIYRPLTDGTASGLSVGDPAAAPQSDERTCPWCAETIKAAAVVCRFCGRDVQVQANAG